MYFPFQYLKVGDVRANGCEVYFSRLEFFH